MVYTRLYADADGESHFEDLEVELHPTDFAAPAPLLDLSDYRAAAQFAFLGAPAGWIGDWHPSLGRNIFFVLTGEWEIEASDGEVRRFAAGDVLQVEDTSGRGHASRVISATESMAAVVQLAELPIADCGMRNAD